MMGLPRRNRAGGLVAAALVLASLAPAEALDAGTAPPPDTPPRGGQIYGSDFSGLMEDAYAPKPAPEEPQDTGGRVKFRVEPRDRPPSR